MTLSFAFQADVLRVYLRPSWAPTDAEAPIMPAKFTNDILYGTYCYRKINAGITQ